jgi:hypothetical protein
MQDTGSDQMQIEIIDDCSSDDIASEVTRRVGAGRVTFRGESENLGLANAWNRCLELAHRKLVVSPEGFLLDVLWERKTSFLQ